MTMAYQAYLQCYDGEELEEDAGNILIRNEKQKVYMLNTLGNTCDSISVGYNKKLIKEGNTKKKDELKHERDIYSGRAYKYCDMLGKALERSASLRREVYIRSQGVIMEHLYENGELNCTIDEISGKYEEAILFAIKNNDISRNSLYTWLSFYKKNENLSNYSTDKKAIIYSRLASNIYPNEIVFKEFEMFAMMNIYRHSNNMTKKEIKRDMDALMEYLNCTCNYSLEAQDDYMQEINKHYKLLTEYTKSIEELLICYVIVDQEYEHNSS